MRAHATCGVRVREIWKKCRSPKLITYSTIVPTFIYIRCVDK